MEKGTDQKDLNAMQLPTNNTPLVWTVDQAAELLGISRAHAYELIARGELDHLRLGRRIVVPKRVIVELIGASSQE